MNCSLCEATGCTAFLNDGRRSFCFCKNCELLFVPKEGWITIENEKKRYALHDNTVGNKGYFRFLNDIADTIEALHLADRRILDFGCGEKMVLSGILEGKGLKIDSYDPLYAIGNECLSKRYDVLVLCEVVEHLRNLKQEIRIIRQMLDKYGVIILRTNIYPSREEFRTWWYKEDMTHINFFARKSLEIFASDAGVKKVEKKHKNIFLLEN